MYRARIRDPYDPNTNYELYRRRIKYRLNLHEWLLIQSLVISVFFPRSNNSVNELDIRISFRRLGCIYILGKTPAKRFLEFGYYPLLRGLELRAFFLKFTFQLYRAVYPYYLCAKTRANELSRRADMCYEQRPKSGEPQKCSPGQTRIDQSRRRRGEGLRFRKKLARIVPASDNLTDRTKPRLANKLIPRIKNVVFTQRRNDQYKRRKRNLRHFLENKIANGIGNRDCERKRKDGRYLIRVLPDFDFYQRFSTYAFVENVRRAPSWTKFLSIITADWRTIIFRPKELSTFEVNVRVVRNRSRFENRDSDKWVSRRMGGGRKISPVYFRTIVSHI